MKKFFTRVFILCILVCALVIGSIYTFNSYNVVYEKEIDIFDGASVKQIAELLENYGAIKNADVFYYYIKAKSIYHEQFEEKPLELLFKQGKYQLVAGDFDSLISKLNEGPDEEIASHIITIPEGSSIEKIADILAKKELFSKEEFLTYIQNEQTYKKYQTKYKWLPAIDPRKHYLLEGYLQANTYNLPNEPTVELITDMMLSETDGWYTRNQSLIESTGITFDAILTLASVVEAESKFTVDRPKVAQVFLNRLGKNMKLESDMTAAYANREHKVFMYNKDIKTASPFNTYHIVGLPIGPINAPSSESFVAVLKPSGKAFTSIYFYARPSGETFYADTWELHEKNRLLYEHEWKALEKDKK